jgi:outer membrane lipoprotein SlyB
MHPAKPVSRPPALTSASAIAAAIAALSLAACGPHEASEASAMNVGTAATQTEPGSVPMQGTPVPPALPVTAAPVPVGTSYAPPAPVVVGQAPGAYAAQPNYVPAQRPVVETAPIDRSRIGSVQSIEPIRTRPQGSGAGAVVGGVLGAVVGHQFGSGVGRVAMTGLGAAGGAVAGNNVERNHNESISGYRVSIRLDNGTTRTFERSQVAGLQVGDRVRLDAESFHRD